MWEKKEEKKEEKEESLLKELCRDDAKLYEFLSYYLYEHPLAAISKKDLDILTEEAEKSGTLDRHWIRPFSRPLKTRGKGEIHQSCPKPRVEDHTRDGARKRKGREERTHRPGCFPWERN